jgi:hypothetical protein
VKEVEKAAKTAREKDQAELASFLEDTHSHLRMHHEDARRIEKSLGNQGMASERRGTTSGGTSPSGTTSPGTRATGPGSTSGGSTGSR